MHGSKVSRQVGVVKSTAAVGRTSTSVKARVWCRFETVLRVGFCRITNEETSAHRRELWHQYIGLFYIPQAPALTKPGSRIREQRGSALELWHYKYY
jgi:hypothetical protein